MYFVIHNSVVLSKILKIVCHNFIKAIFKKMIFDSTKLIILIIINIDKQNGTMIFNILDNTTELYMTKEIIGEIFSSGGATLYKNPSDQTVCNHSLFHYFPILMQTNIFFKISNSKSIGSTENKNKMYYYFPTFSNNLVGNGRHSSKCVKLIFE